jgi:hypothetical protein
MQENDFKGWSYEGAPDWVPDNIKKRCRFLQLRALAIYFVAEYVASWANKVEDQRHKRINGPHDKFRPGQRFRADRLFARELLVLSGWCCIKK